MDRNKEDDHQTAANSSTNFMARKSPDLNLVGNFFPGGLGEKFPEKPPFTYKPESVVRDTVCVLTKGVGRIFIPIELIATLSDNVQADIYEIVAAPGVAPIPEETGEIEAKNRSEYGLQRIQYYLWYWKSFIDAVKPIDKFIPEHGKLQFMPGTVFQIRPTWQTLFQITLEQINADILMHPRIMFQLD